MSLKLLPPAHEILAAADFCGIAEEYRTRIVRNVLSRFRAQLAKEPRAYRDRATVTSAILGEVNHEVRKLLTPFPQRVINGTGILVHTNLGRAPLTAVDLTTVSHYSNLEWDTDTQKRSSRDRHLDGLLRLLTGAEAALAVNNCASALLLALHTIARDREVLVSRSELVEIGGGFRVPEIMEVSGCRLVEVGTTNKTRLEDYAKKLKSKQTVLLKVHQSNFVQQGFVESVGLSELAQLGRKRGVPLVYDNGSGLLSRPEPAFLESEPTVEQGLKDGASVVVCSADKLLGSVQAGILVGKASLVERMKKNPLYRALRLDKVRLALLHHTLTLYATGRENTIPIWQMATAKLEHWREKLRLPPGVEWVTLKAQTGGGSNPERSFDSLGLRISGRSAQEIKTGFASRPVPILGYIHANAFYLDVRTLLPDDFIELQRALDDL